MHMPGLPSLPLGPHTCTCKTRIPICTHARMCALATHLDNLAVIGDPAVDLCLHIRQLRVATHTHTHTHTFDICAKKRGVTDSAWFAISKVPATGSCMQQST